MKQIPNVDVLTSTLASTKKAILILGPTPNFDSVAAALGMSLALKAKGIDVQVACPADMRVEFNRLVGVDQVKKKIGNRNLVVSFPYAEDKVEKVIYTISEDNKRFNLVISPKNGGSPLEPSAVSFELAGAEAELIVLFGVGGFEELGELYQSERTVFDTAMTLAVTLFPNQPFAKCHVDASETSSLSEVTAYICEALKLTLDADSASNLLAGIDTVSGGFRGMGVSADTFELVARLMRAGARRQPVSDGQMLQPTQMPFMAPPTNVPAPQQASTNQFAQLLGASQAKAAPTAPFQPPVPSEMKG